MKTKIYVVTHKMYDFPQNDMYVPIQVNAKKNEHFLKVCDDNGDNISYKNENYCELTAAYYIWKNVTCDIIGLNHYRRYLSLKDISIIKNAKSHEKLFELILTKEEIENTLKDYDVIVPITKLITKNVYSKYKEQHYIKDLENAKKIIMSRYPDMENSFEKVMSNKKYAICNMFVMKKKYFDDYCSWLFEIMFELEKVTNMDGYSKLQKRMYGFLSERLFNVWLDYKGLKIKEANMVLLEHDTFKIILRKSYRRLLHIKS